MTTKAEKYKLGPREFQNTLTWLAFMYLLDRFEEDDIEFYCSEISIKNEFWDRMPKETDGIYQDVMVEAYFTINWNQVAAAFASIRDLIAKEEDLG